MHMNDIDTYIFFISVVLLLIFLDSQFMSGGNIAVIFLLANFIKNSKLYISNGAMTKKIILYFLYLLFITLLNINTNYDIRNSLSYFAEVSIIFFSCGIALAKANIIKLMRLLRNLGVILGILGIIEGILQYPYISILLRIPCEIAYDYNGYRIVSIFGHPIITGVFFTFIWSLLFCVPYRVKYVNIISHIILLLGIILCRSRSVWLSVIIALFIVIILYVYRNKNRISRKLFIGIVKLILFIFMVDLVTGFSFSSWCYNFFSSRIVGSLYAGVGAGNIIRIDTVLNSITYWMNGNYDKLFWGMGKNYDRIFMQIFPVIKFDRAWTAAIDNQYFTILHESGIIGLIFILNIAYYAIQRLIKTTNLMGIAFNITIIEVYISMYFYEGMNFMSILLILFILINLSDRNIFELNRANQTKTINNT